MCQLFCRAYLTFGIKGLKCSVVSLFEITTACFTQWSSSLASVISYCMKSIRKHGEICYLCTSIWTLDTLHISTQIGSVIIPNWINLSLIIMRRVKNKRRDNQLHILHILITNICYGLDTATSFLGRHKHNSGLTDHGKPNHIYILWCSMVFRYHQSVFSSFQNLNQTYYSHNPNFK